MIDVPGLNVMYGDRDGNIAWWTAAKLVRRPAHVNSKLFLDGASGQDDPLGFYDFSENPQCENPPWGYVYSANNQPDTLTGHLYPGYYVPEDRARRIVSYLQADKRWSVKAMQKMDTDCTSPVAPEITTEILKTLQDTTILTKTANHREAFRILSNWNGDHQVQDVAPTIYYMLLSCIMENTFADETGMPLWKEYLSQSYIIYVPDLLLARMAGKNNHILFDNVLTTPLRETRDMMIQKSMQEAMEELTQRLGPDPGTWTWGKVHRMTFAHPLPVL